MKEAWQFLLKEKSEAVCVQMKTTERNPLIPEQSVLTAADQRSMFVL